jgi:1-acyl-sn-glycerol-3-phosphate acyltransferase
LKEFLLRWLTYLIIIPLMGLWTALCGMLSLLFSQWDKSGVQQHAIARIWAKGMLLLALSPIKIVHPERLRRKGGAVFACNHLSYMDTPALFGSLPFQFRILANHYLFKYPFAGWHLTRSGQVPIDQSSMRSQVAGLMKGVATLKAGMPLLLFPDGSRSRDGHVHQFMSGAAFMALKAQVPIIPMALIGTHELLPMHTYHLNPRPLKLIVGEAIETTGHTTKEAPEFTDKLFQAISAMYYQYSPLERPALAPASDAKDFTV